MARQQGKKYRTSLGPMAQRFRQLISAHSRNVLQAIRFSFP